MRKKDVEKWLGSSCCVITKYGLGAIGIIQPTEEYSGFFQRKKYRLVDPMEGRIVFEFTAREIKEIKEW